MFAQYLFIQHKIAVEVLSWNFSMIKVGGGGFTLIFFVKLGFEIAVDQQTRTGDRTFEGVPDPNRQTVPVGQPRPYLVQIRPNLAKYPDMPKTMLWDALLVATSLLNTYIKFYQNWIKIGRVMG